ncbi:helix-turn-helix domain-containing protein [Ancylobacter pratisalsi]|uniref:Helix-turn-helix domain-containing protein n=1 Tax=Ancylobacter pratisalsi TaxID=1745854 RepID=A0A6P1YH82_9HYPH|nr:helix-turn-helix domain-containing protein [Ancylobacter pratisalsi]QIB32647.1 helix-turn-helix domain-containing protein [Ancylobacter pratisalsi]
MSVEAITWSNKRRAGSAGAKLVLLALANYADEDGYCYPSQATLADVTEMSRDSISRHIKTLESLGLLEREPRFDKKGRRTTDMVRLLLTAQGTPQIAGVGTPQKQGVPPPQEQGVRTPQKQGDLNHQKEPSKEKTPQTPEGAGDGFSNSDGEGQEGVTPAEASDTQFDVLWAQYGADPAASRTKALRAWARLASADRAQALAMLPRFLDHCRAARRRICDPSTYLAERRWEAMASLPAPAAKADEAPKRTAETDPVRKAVMWVLNATTKTDWHFVEEESDAWEAWRCAFIAAGFGLRWTRGRHLQVQDEFGRWTLSAAPGRTFPQRYPPKAGNGDGASDATGPPDDRPSAEEIEKYMGSGG